MSTESTAKQVAPLACTRCGDEDGPFTKDGLCEGCDPEARLLSALEDGGWLGDSARQLIDAYAAAVIHRGENGAAR